MKKYALGFFVLAVCFLYTPGLWADTENTPETLSTDEPHGDIVPAYTPTPFFSKSAVYGSEEAQKETAQRDKKEKEKTLPGGFIKMSGHYRLAAGDNGDDFILNDSNPDFQEKNFRYLYGEALENTYDKAIYSQYLLNVDFSPKDKIEFYTQFVADPWSWVGQTGEQVQRSDVGAEEMRYNLRYFGAFNSVLNQGWRSNNGDVFSFPLIKVHDGQLTSGTVVHGINDFSPATHGIPFTIPQLDIDYDFRPIRKLWMDYNEDQWHARVFALADQSQALATDDPLELSDHKDYWQWSPWIEQYQPVQFFTDGSIKRGYYSNNLAYLARDSEGNRLILLRGASFEGNFGNTYIASTIAAPFTPWDEEFFAASSVPGAVRIKHQFTDRLMIGGVYGFRNGLIDNGIADSNQMGAVDGEYKINDATTFKAEFASDHRDLDLLTDDLIKTDTEGYAYKAELSSSFDHAKDDGHTDIGLSYTQMDKNFDSPLSIYYNTRDDRFWGQHISFDDVSPDLEHYRLGDGVDKDRFVVRAYWKEKRFKERFVNLFDIRNVHRQENTAYIETVGRDEMTYHFTPKLTAKGLIRWQGLPKTTAGVEPFLANFYYNGDFIDLTRPDLVFQNTAIPADKDPSRFTYSGGLQYAFNDQWTAEGIYERTNNIPDFPRGLLDNVFRDAPDRVEALLIDRLTPFLYDQAALDAVPPYKYFNIVRERLTYKPQGNLKFILHATQNGYKFAGGIDDNINHQGLSVSYDYSKKLSFFADYTHSQQIDIPNLIATNLAEKNFDDHHNIYFSMDYHINASTVFRAEYGVFGMGANTPQVTPYSVTSFSLPTIDTEHIVRVSLTGDF